MALTRPSAAQLSSVSVDFTDPLFRINKDQTGVNDKDLGIIFERGSDTNVGLIWDESSDKFSFINTTETGTTSGNVSISSYASLTIGSLTSNGLTYPAADGSNGHYLKTDGAGNLTFAAVTAAPAGSNTQIQYNNNGAAGASANLTFNGTTLSTTGISVSGNISVTGTVDSRDIASDGSKLDGIETGATADQTASEILTAIKTVDGSGSGLDADLLDGVQGSSFLRSDQNDTIDAGVNTTLTILSDDTGASTIQLYGNSQGTGRVYVGQSSTYGGGIEYNGDNSPSTTGAGADFVTLYRRENGTDHWTARNQYNSNNWQFRADVSATNFNGVASSAKYADLAENYLADQDYPIGTVLDIGGKKEVTIATKESYKIAGTVSENPGYLMNSQIEGDYITPVAYIGRVPCRVEGVIKRGDILVVGNTPGVAIACHPHDILPGQAIGKALESYNNIQEGLIEILVGRL